MPHQQCRDFREFLDQKRHPVAVASPGKETVTTIIPPVYFMLGDRVILIDASLHRDWRRHENQVGVIVLIDSDRYSCKIQWADGEHSRAPASNLIHDRS